MEKEFLVNKRMKKQDLKKWYNSILSCRIRIIIGRTLQIIGCVIFVGLSIASFIYFSITDELRVGLLCGSGMGAVLGIIPFAIGQSIGIKAREKYGSPYIEMEKETIIISDQCVKFIYCDKENIYVDSRDVYTIKNENINAVNYNAEFNIVTIIGKGELISYDNILTKKIVPEKSQRKFYSNSPYCFMLSFDNKDEILEMLKSKVKRQEE